MLRTVVVILAVVMCALNTVQNARADTLAPETLPFGGTATVTRVVDGDTVVLDNGRQVRFVGIQAPKLALGRANFTPWPLAEDAKAFVEDAALGKTVKLYLAPTPEDRHGRILAHIVVEDTSTWLQGALLRAGLARVYTFPDNRALADALISRERLARADNRGLWGLPYYAVRTADNVRHDAGSFQIVEGRVLDVAKIKKWIYLNFGADWRSDFTISVQTKYETLFQQAGVDVLNLKGAKVRVRGWVKSRNGPMIELDHPERFEIISR